MTKRNMLGLVVSDPKYVISAPVILNGGYIYTETLFKRGQRVRVNARERSETERARVKIKKDPKPIGSFLGF